jgi:endonuclease YncB( thermonuclease family)
MAVQLGTCLVILLTFAAGGRTEAAEEPRRAFTCDERVSDQVVEAVTKDGEFRLAGGASVRTADLRLASEGEAGRRASAWLSSLAGTTLRIREVGPPDRWGRAPAHIELPGATAIDLGELLVSEGLAVVDAGGRDLLCRPELLQAEDRARRSRVGLWREGTWPIAVSALEKLGQAAGHFAIIQGRVVSVGERRERTYLNFGRDWSRDFNVTIPRRSWETLKARGISAASLTGRIVRVRGMIEMRRSPTLDLTVADMLELVDTTAGTKSE